MFIKTSFHIEIRVQDEWTWFTMISRVQKFPGETYFHISQRRQQVKATGYWLATFSCAVLDIMPGGTKWQCSGDTEWSSEAWDWWQAQTVQTEPCCSLWPSRAWELDAGTPHGPCPHTEHNIPSRTDYCCPVNTLNCGEINTQILLMDIFVM